MAEVEIIGSWEEGYRAGLEAAVRALEEHIEQMRRYSTRVIGVVTRIENFEGAIAIVKALLEEKA